METIVVNSIVLAGSYTLLALGWVVVFRATQVLNFAVGEFMALGGYIFYGLIVAEKLPLVASLIGAVVCSAIIAGGAYWLFLRRLVSQPPYVAVVLTIGLSILLSSILAMAAGPQSRALPLPFKNRIYNLPGNAHVTLLGIFTVVLGIVVVGALLSFFRYTSFGIQMRAAAELPGLAGSTGINVTRIFVVAWMIGGVVTALGGITYGWLDVVSPQTSQLGLRGIAPALVGGFESIGGTIVGSLLVALTETTGVRYLGGGSDDAVVFAVLLVFVLIRPAGIFGSAGVRRV